MSGAQPQSLGRIPVGMRPGAREFRDASLTISVSQAVPEHMRDRVREVSHLFVKPASRRQRLATALMNFVCQEADANKMTLVLTVCPYHEDGVAEQGMNDAELATWYERFGFQKVQDTPLGQFMARQVREKPRITPIAAAVSRALH